ncbi:MAG: sialate O-acetylesterase [Candidatus Latescibacter sp.]|nr:sialate O-acetylesterase [Candidatus Latescibacter sp.]
MKKYVNGALIPLALMFLAISPAWPDVKTPSIFGDSMVLQRGIPLPVWGMADPGEKVTVTLGDNSASTAAGKDGRWMIRLKKMDAGGPYEMKVAGNNSLTFKDVLVGEVWVCSGQSNMWWQIRQVTGIEHEIASANYPNLHYFSTNLVSKEEPQFDFPGKKPLWTACSPETVKNFSAVAYYFGKAIHQDLGVPVGLIHTSWGGSVAEAWTRIEALKSKPELRPIVDDLEGMKAAYSKAKEEYNRKSTEFAKAQGGKGSVPPMPLPPRAPGERDWPSGLYNAMIAPMVPYGIRGAIWYQGESNSVRAWQYRTLFPTMIKDWRKAWNEGDFPFLYVQIANWKTSTIPVVDTWGSWPELREAQLMTLSLPKTGMAVSIDIGDSTNIHPNDKWDVGRRLSLAALHVAYGQNIVFSGPVYRSMKKDGNRIRLRFDNTDGGLTTRAGEPLQGFTIAGEDKVFHPASARFSGAEVLVSAENVPKPVAVRYGWADNPYCNLYNTAGLPASPFRTDSWKGITEGKVKP